MSVPWVLGGAASFGATCQTTLRPKSGDDAPPLPEPGDVVIGRVTKGDGPFVWPQGWTISNDGRLAWRTYAQGDLHEVTVTYPSADEVGFDLIVLPAAMVVRT
jgi:hypothetical protein